MVRAVFLDLGDTLVHLDRPREEVFHANLQALSDYLAKVRLELDFERFTATFMRMFDDATYRASLYKVEMPLEEILSKALRKSGLEFLGIDLPTNATIEFYRPELESWQLYPDTVETLTQLSKDGYALGVVSNAKSDWMVRAIIERRDLRKFLKSIVSSAALGIRKPRREIFDRALTALNVSPQDAVFVGDSLQADVWGSKMMGMRSIHVLRKQVDDTEPPPKPDATVASLAETVEIIHKWNSFPDG